ncbi:MAG: 4-hydroxy-tetrahydrodipicolinate synthase [Steroidobacteraceae bacterium]
MFSGSLVAIVTPMNADGSVDYAAWERLLDLHVASGTAGIVIGGTTGESPTVTEEELQALVSAARQHVGTRVKLLAGAGTSSTAGTVERVRRLQGLGLDALLVVTPAYNKPGQEGLYRHYEAVASAGDVPLMLYNVPARTAVDMLPQTVARLAKLPGIVAVKEAVGSVERVRELVALCGGDFAVLSGDDATARAAVLAGASGVVSVTANVAPAAMAAMIQAARQGQAELAARHDGPLAELHRSLFVEANPVPVKWALAQLGYIGTGIRLPLTWLATGNETTVLNALQHAGLTPGSAAKKVGNA